MWVMILNSSKRLIPYMNRIMAAIAVVLALYGFFYIADQIFSYFHMYAHVFTIWTVFQLFLVAAILYMGAMIFEIGRIIFRKMLLSRKSSRFAPLMMTLIVSIPILIPLCSSLLLVHEDEFGGYFGYYRDHTSARITDSIDLQALCSRAQAKGYDVTYNPASLSTGWFPYMKLAPSEEYWVVSDWRDPSGGRTLHICLKTGDETLFDYAVPTSAYIQHPSESPEDWYQSKLCEFFPNLTEEECHDLTETLLSGHFLNISSNLDWESIKNYLGTINRVHSPITEFIEYYGPWGRKGRIFYNVPFVNIKRSIILGIGKTATFTVLVNDRGFARIGVNSKYLLNTNWIRAVFVWMFFDIGLPIDTIRKFRILENWRLSLN